MRLPLITSGTLSNQFKALEQKLRFPRREEILPQDCSIEYPACLPATCISDLPFPTIILTNFLK